MITNRINYIYNKFNIHNYLHRIFFFKQKINKNNIYKKQTKKPISTSIIQSKINSKNLIKQTLRIQN